MTDQPDGPDSIADEHIDWPEERHSLLALSNDQNQQAFIDWWPGNLGRRYGYKQAAEKLGQLMLAAHASDRDLLVFPWLNCWRHYVELELKHMLNVCEVVLGNEKKIRITHKVDLLWRDLKPMLHKLQPDDGVAEIKILDRLIEQLAWLDPDSMHSRYSNLKDGTPTLQHTARLDVIEVHDAVSGLGAFFGGAESAIEHDQEVRDEMRDYGY